MNLVLVLAVVCVCGWQKVSRLLMLALACACVQSSGAGCKPHTDVICGGRVGG